MTANTYLQVTELDFARIRANLKNYLSTQSQFKDYDFEGSAIGTLLDILSYNTHYNAFYVNMLANEMFLDTAQQRDSVASFAKMLGYVPISSIGAQANVQVSFTGISNTVNQFTIPKNSTFTSTIEDVTYTFVTPQAYTIKKNNGSFSAPITIKEGRPLTHRFTKSEDPNQRFVLPNKNVDVSSIIVKVQNSVSDTTTEDFTRATNINQVFSTSPVYFVEEAYDEKYEIIFGNGTLGKALINGNIVIVEYLVNNADVTNGANVFSQSSVNIGVDYTGLTVTTNKRALGGRPMETVESIKFNAPRNYQTQNRAVVKNDYQRIILNENADLQSVIAFGGEEADPPVYGKVYVAVKPFGELFTTQTRKNQIKSQIEDRTPLSIDPVIIDPEYTYIIPVITTYYDKTVTTATEAAIEQAVRDAIQTYSTNNLERFGNRLRYSKFVRTLDNIQTGRILNNDANITIQKRINPNLQQAEKITLNFSNPIRQGTLTSTQFVFNGFDCFLDDNNGIVRIFRFDSNRQKVFVRDNSGTINYTTGKVEINDFGITAYTGIEMRITVTPNRLDVVPLREQILIMNASESLIGLVGES